MHSKYLDQFYNHFNKSKRQDHNPLTRDKNYLMRFQTLLPYSYAKEQNAFSLVYSNSPSPMKLITTKGASNLRKGQFSILNPTTDWEFICSEKERVDVLSFVLSEKFMAAFSYAIENEQRRLVDTPYEYAASPAPFIENIYNAHHSQTGRFLKHLFEQSNDPVYATLDPKEIVFELLGVLHQEHQDYKKGIRQIKGKKETTKQEIFKRILVAYEYINDSYLHKKISIEELSLVCGLSEFHLYSAFKAIYGKTPHQYLTYLKIQKAKSFLEAGTGTISEIATRLHFPDLPSFSKLFKKTYGYAPSTLILNS